MGKKFFSVRVLILLVVLVSMVLAINPNPFASGIEVRSVSGVAAENGISVGSVIKSVNGKVVNSISEFNNILDNVVGENAEYVIKTDKIEAAFVASERLDIIVKDASKTNIKKGLDLEGGTRVLLSPVSDEEVTDSQINSLIGILDNRLNVYGLSDLVIRSAKDRDGNNLVLVEIAGASREEVRDLIESQGVFEAKIANKTVFGGGDDITFVCKDDGSCSGIRACDPDPSGGYNCRFEFEIRVTPEAAKRHANLTKELDVVVGESGNYLSENLDLFLDGVLVDSLRISEGLRGSETTSILISGPGIGVSEREAYEDALSSMNKLQTVLITGSLPFGLKIEKLDSISPVFGEDLIKNAFLVGFLSILAVAIVIYIRYRKFKLAIPMIIIMVSEIFILLGLAALIQWRLDIVSIAGIVTAVGTGVDDQIVISDEVLRGESRFYNWKQRIKNAFFIIFAAYATTFVAMAPLWNAGAGLIRGFALTTILGITVGVFITRPAYASIVEWLLE